MPFKYAHITWTDSPEAVANQLEKWAGYLLKDAENLKKENFKDLYSKSANEQMQIQHENPKGLIWKDKSRMLLEIVDDLEELQKLREKIHVVELKTKEEKWEEFAVTQRPLYTKKAIQKLPDDMIYLISTYLEDELTLTEDVGGRFGAFAFRSTWWKGCVQMEFHRITEHMNIWTLDAIKMFWVKNVIPKMTFHHVTEGLQCHFDTSSWENDETNNWYRAYLVRAIVKWGKDKLIDNFKKLYSVQADTNCSFKFQIENPVCHYPPNYQTQYTQNQYTPYKEKFFVSVNNYSENHICNKDMYHILKSVNWLHKNRLRKISKYKNIKMKNVDTFYPFHPNLFLQPCYLDKWEWDELHKEYIERNPNHFRVAHSRNEMIHLDKVDDTFR
jgi:hypothetical protein